jgi:hypothetical protein
MFDRLLLRLKGVGLTSVDGSIIFEAILSSQRSFSFFFTSSRLDAEKLCKPMRMSFIIGGAFRIRFNRFSISSFDSFFFQSASISSRAPFAF